jgi:stalled ribosome alternative rescue factor ArfA
MGGMQRASSKPGKGSHQRATERLGFRVLGFRSGKGSHQRVTERDAREVGATAANQGYRITPFIPFNNTTHKVLAGYR